MSRKAEEAHERWFAQHEIDCAEHFVVGAKVYRADWERVEEGVLRKIGRCNIASGSHSELVEREDGKHPLYVAKFGGTTDYNGTWLEQTFAWKFFWSEQDARKELVKGLRGRIIEKTHEIEKLEKLIASLNPPIHVVEGASR